MQRERGMALDTLYDNDDDAEQGTGTSNPMLLSPSSPAATAGGGDDGASRPTLRDGALPPSGGRPKIALTEVIKSLQSKLASMDSRQAHGQHAG
jgi:hypothetical protein